MKKLIIVAVLAFSAAAIYMLVIRKQPTDQSYYKKGLYPVGAVAFETAPMEKLDVAAVYLQTEMTHSELVTRSPVLRDLLNTKLKILTDAIAKKLSENGQQPSSIELYMENPWDKSDAVAKRTKLPLKFSSQRPSQGIVKTGEKYFGRQDLPMNQVHYSQVELQIFEEKLRVVGDLYTKQLLLKIAKDNNTTIQGYINKSILGLPLKDISDLEVKLFARDKGIDFSESDSALKERLRQILQERKTESSIEEHLKTKYPSEVGKIYFYPPTMVIPMNDASAVYSVKANDSTLPTMMIFSSLKCGGCDQLAGTLDEIRRNNRNKIRFGFVHFFYGDDWRDHLAAQASVCLNAQSNDAFWNFFVRISKSKEEITESLVRETAKATGVDEDEFEKCFIAQTFKDEVYKQVKYATQLGVQSPPTVIYGSRVLVGTNLKRQLEEAIVNGPTN